MADPINEAPKHYSGIKRDMTFVWWGHTLHMIHMPATCWVCLVLGSSVQEERPGLAWLVIVWPWEHGPWSCLHQLQHCLRHQLLILAGDLVLSGNSYECNADNNIARSLVPHVVTLELVIQENISMVDISLSLAKYKPLSIINLSEWNVSTLRTHFPRLTKLSRERRSKMPEHHSWTPANKAAEGSEMPEHIFVGTSSLKPSEDPKKPEHNSWVQADKVRLKDREPEHNFRGLRQPQGKCCSLWNTVCMCLPKHDSWTV